MNRSDSRDSFEQIEDSSTASRDDCASSDAESIHSDDIQVLHVRRFDNPPVIMDSPLRMAFADPTSTQALLAGLEARILVEIRENHQKTTSRLDQLEARIDGLKIDLLKSMETMAESTANHSEGAVKEQTNKDDLADIKEQVKAIKELQIAELQRQEKANEEKKDELPKSSAKRACGIVKKEAVECFDKIKKQYKNIKSRVIVNPVSPSTDGPIDIASEVRAEDPALQSVLLKARKACRIGFRSEGSKNKTRWFVAGVTEPPPCVLRKGDEIVSISGVPVAGVTLERVKELITQIKDQGVVEVRRPTAAVPLPAP